MLPGERPLHNCSRGENYETRVEVGEVGEIWLDWFVFVQFLVIWYFWSFLQENKCLRWCRHQILSAYRQCNTKTLDWKPLNPYKWFNSSLRHLLLSIFSSASFSWEGDVGHQEGSQLNIQELWFRPQNMHHGRKTEHIKNMQTQTKTNYKLNFDHMTLLLSVLLICNLRSASLNLRFGRTWQHVNSQ